MNAAEIQKNDRNFILPTSIPHLTFCNNIQHNRGGRVIPNAVWESSPNSKFSYNLKECVLNCLGN